MVDASSGTTYPDEFTMNDKAPPLAEEANAYYEDLLRPVFAGRKFLMAGETAAAMSLSGLARRLTGLGAARPFLVAASEGTGPLPTPDEAELRVLGIQSTDMLDDFRKLGPGYTMRGARPLSIRSPTTAMRCAISRTA